jgi:hypothetical protein
MFGRSKNPPAKPANDAGAQPLKEALREARIVAPERSAVVVDLRDAEAARLELLNEALDPAFKEIPNGVELFDRGVSKGDVPRLWIDVIAHVEMGHDKRQYRFVQDTRYGRAVETLQHPPPHRPAVDPANGGSIRRRPGAPVVAETLQRARAAAAPGIRDRGEQAIEGLSQPGLLSRRLHRLGQRRLAGAGRPHQQDHLSLRCRHRPDLGPFLGPLELELREALGHVADLPGGLGQEHRRRVDVLGHGGAMGGGEGLDVGVRARQPAGLGLGRRLEHDVEDFVSTHRTAMAEDIDQAPVFLAKSAWEIGYVTERFPKVAFERAKERA